MEQAAGNDTTFRQVITVSELNRETRDLLERAFPLVWVEGELSNVARPRSGHIYFTLKDDRAQVRCAMFRNRNMHLPFAPEDGMQVLVRAKVGFYEPRGEFQLVVEHMEEAGDGALRRAFEALKQRLSAEGLFDAGHKRPLPTLPRRIGVVTSPTGAAIRDILTVLRRRFPGIPVTVYPVPVQGEGAAEAIAAMIGVAGRRAECDVLVVGRGGGSLEDLWAFNEEVVARAIHACPLPVVAAVGHEVDFTIADFVADQRAPTPSAAAELLSPNGEEWARRVDGLGRRLDQAMARRLQRDTERLRGLRRRLQHPGRRLQDIAQRLDDLEGRLRRAEHNLLRHREARVAQLHARLHRYTPLHRVRQLQDRCTALDRRLDTAVQHRLDGVRSRLGAATRQLEAVSPLAVLGRGYAIVTHAETRSVIRDAGEVTVGDAVEARLGHGRLRCEVKETIDE